MQVATFLLSQDKGNKLMSAVKDTSLLICSSEEIKIQKPLTLPQRTTATNPQSLHQAPAPPTPHLLLQVALIQYYYLKNGWTSYGDSKLNVMY